tara:strand:+ start:62 stop:196 length:135 start_codon:yes stop_codon:yes gene_type:complete
MMQSSGFSKTNSTLEKIIIVKDKTENPTEDDSVKEQISINDLYS